GYVLTGGVTVTFSLTNDATATSVFKPAGANTCVTASSGPGLGTCSVTITSPTPGQTTIHATYTTSVGGVSITRSTGDSHAGDSADATKNWVDANLAISPLTASNEIGKNHVITATVNTNDGSGSGYQLTGGVVVQFSLTNDATATASFVGPSSCTTSSVADSTLGTCTVT